MFFLGAAHLLTSAGMDHTVHVWNVWDKGNTTARVLKHHTAAVKDVRWSPHSLSLLSGGLDCSVQLIDVVEGKVIKVLRKIKLWRLSSSTQVTPISSYLVGRRVLLGYGIFEVVW